MVSSLLWTAMVVIVQWMPMSSREMRDAMPAVEVTGKLGLLIMRNRLWYESTPATVDLDKRTLSNQRLE